MLVLARPAASNRRLAAPSSQRSIFPPMVYLAAGRAQPLGDATTLTDLTANRTPEVDMIDAMTNSNAEPTVELPSPSFLLLHRHFPTAQHRQASQ